MTAKRPTKPRGGSAPRFGDTAATKQLPIRLTPEQVVAWKALAEERGIPLSELVRAAVAHLETCDKPDASLAKLGSDVVELVKAHSKEIAVPQIIGTDREDELSTRALAAYRRTEGATGDSPAGGLSGVEEHGGRHYVVLRNVRGVLACYLVSVDGSKLRRLRDDELPAGRK